MICNNLVEFFLNSVDKLILGTDFFAVDSCLTFVGKAVENLISHWDGF